MLGWPTCSRLIGMGQTVVVFLRVDPPFQLDVDGAVKESVEHGVGHDGIGEELVTLAGRQLTCDQRRAALSSVTDHLEEVMLGLAFLGADAPIIPDEKIRLASPVSISRQLPSTRASPSSKQSRGSRK